MPLIEGLGDEVTLVLGGFCICVILTLAWFSTHTADIPLLREVGVIVVELSQRRNQGQNQRTREGLEENNERSQNEESNSAESAAPVRTEEQPRAEENSLLNTGAESKPAGSGDDRSSDSANVPKPRETASVDEEVESSTALQGNVSSLNSLAEVAETLVHESTHEALRRAPHHISNTDDTENEGNRSETFIPKASVTVDTNSGVSQLSGEETPTDEELRQRRVRYFQSSGASASTTSVAAGENRQDIETSNLPDPNSQASHEKLVSDPTSKHAGTSEEITDSSRQTTETNSASVTDSGDNTVQEQPELNNASNAQSEPSDSMRIRVKLKYMNETQRLVYASPYDTIGDFRRTHFQTELEDNKWVRFIYNGQDLRDDARTLQACNVGDNCTMHCLITAQTRPSSTREAVHEEEDDSFMGALMYPLFTIVLLIVWYFRFTYRQYFSAMSTVCLIGISFLLGLSYISSMRTPEHRTQQQRAAQAGGAGAATQGQAEHQHAD